MHALCINNYNAKNKHQSLCVGMNCNEVKIGSWKDLFFHKIFISHAIMLIEVENSHHVMNMHSIPRQLELLNVKSKVLQLYSSLG